MHRLLCCRLFCLSSTVVEDEVAEEAEMCTIRATKVQVVMTVLYYRAEKGG